MTNAMSTDPDAEALMDFLRNVKGVDQNVTHKDQCQSVPFRNGL